jgi:soluble lytic murein transglycosylase-like protein
MRRFSSAFHLLALLALALTGACASPIATDVPTLGPPPADTVVAQPVAEPAAAISPTANVPLSGPQQVKALLIGSAQRHGVNSYLVMGVAWWESGWDQSQVSPTGAVGIMQVEPATARAAGPKLLHRVANIHDSADNIELGTVVLKEDLDNFHNDLVKALIAYYAGPAAVTDWNDQDAGAKRYVWGVYRLALAFSKGTGPA